jgi:ABC-type branched-subunit amino acid transport system ATPase component
VSGLRKAYGSFEALHGIDFRHEGGEVFALLGLSGSGKTTTVETLEGRSAVDRARAQSLLPGRLLASSEVSAARSHRSGRLWGPRFF